MGKNCSTAGAWCWVDKSDFDTDLNASVTVTVRHRAIPRRVAKHLQNLELVFMRDFEELELRLRQLGHWLATVQDLEEFFKLDDDHLRQHLDGLAHDLGTVAVSLELPLVSVADGASGLCKRRVIFNCNQKKLIWVKRYDKLWRFLSLGHLAFLKMDRFRPLFLFISVFSTCHNLNSNLNW